jgi:hypothetical protein
MDLSIANLEPFVVFHDFLEEFDRNIKVTYGALALTRRMSPNSMSNAGNRLVRLPTEDEPWGPDTKWRNLDTVVSNSKLFIAQIGLMRIFSAFEDFLIGIKAEYDRFEHEVFQKSSAAASAGAKDDVGLRQLCRSINMPISSLDAILPIFDYFVVLRNCLAHRSGRASRALVTSSRSMELRVAMKNWPVRPGRTLPELPQLVQGKQISLLARHAIFAGLICRELAKLINDHLVAHLGSKGVVLMAAHHSLLKEEPPVNSPRRDAEAVVNETLSSRYRVRMKGGHEAIPFLKDLGQWKDCRLRFRQLYGSESS